MNNGVERIAANEALFDYVLTPFEPLAPAAGKLKTSNLLFHSFALSGCEPRFYQLVYDLREAIGHGQTVWGLKRIGTELAWEFYFYRHLQWDKVRVANVRAAFSAFAEVAWDFDDERLPYEMFSIDVPRSPTRLERLHVYFNRGWRAWAYESSPGKIEFENFYEFFEPSDRKTILKQLRFLPFFHSGAAVEDVLLPEFTICRRVCIAAKRRAGGVYFQGLSIGQFQFFLARFEYPAALQEWVDRHSAQLDYVQFDVGFDFCSANGELRVLKSGFYGIF